MNSKNYFLSTILIFFFSDSNYTSVESTLPVFFFYSYHFLSDLFLRIRLFLNHFLFFFSISILYILYCIAARLFSPGHSVIILISEIILTYSHNSLTISLFSDTSYPYLDKIKLLLFLPLATLAQPVNSLVLVLSTMPTALPYSLASTPWTMSAALIKSSAPALLTMPAILPNMWPCQQNPALCQGTEVSVAFVTAYCQWVI